MAAVHLQLVVLRSRSYLLGRWTHCSEFREEQQKAVWRIRKQPEKTKSVDGSYHQNTDIYNFQDFHIFNTTMF